MRGVKREEGRKEVTMIIFCRVRNVSPSSGGRHGVRFHACAHSEEKGASFLLPGILTNAGNVAYKKRKATLRWRWVPESFRESSLLVHL